MFATDVGAYKEYTSIIYCVLLHSTQLQPSMVFLTCSYNYWIPSLSSSLPVVYMFIHVFAKLWIFTISESWMLGYCRLIYHIEQQHLMIIIKDFNVCCLPSPLTTVVSPCRLFYCPRCLRSPAKAVTLASLSLVGRECDHKMIWMTRTCGATLALPPGHCPQSWLLLR